MSIAVTVFVPAKSQSWSRDELQAYLTEAGFELVLDDFDPAEQSGYVPGRFRGAPAGFEFFADDAAEYLETAEDEGLELSKKDRQRIARFGQVAELVTHSRFHDGLAACIAAGCLAAMTSGEIMDNSSGEWIAAVDAVAWARQRQLEYEPHLAKDLSR
jgi:hypothetical protein